VRVIKQNKIYRFHQNSLNTFEDKNIWGDNKNIYIPSFHRFWKINRKFVKGTWSDSLITRWIESGTEGCLGSAEEGRRGRNVLKLHSFLDRRLSLQFRQPTEDHSSVQLSSSSSATNQDPIPLALGE
jgi:hypothetical protein